tara:strand:- start:108 stop:359 length:252 start_codon:yes stop_codon:yes gene_type:complete
VEKPGNLRRIWLRTKFIFYLLPFWFALIVGINFWNDMSQGQPIDWGFLGYIGAMLAFGAMIFGLGWLVFRFILAASEHEDRRK